jgi:uncharacterized protein DUF6265
MRLAIALVLMSATAGGPPAAPPAVNERLGWLEGCWAGAKKGTSFRETWIAAAPGLMVGVGVTTSPGKPPEFEFLRIESRDGGPAYVAQPGGAPPVAFAWSAAESTEDTAVFVNLEHDFPKRIAYQRLPSGGLLAWIDAGPKGSLRLEYPMSRGTCPGGTP